MVAGVLDMRVGLEGFDVESDRRLAEHLADREDLDFEGLLRELWRSRPEVPARLAERYVRFDMIGEARAAEVAEQIQTEVGEDVFKGAVVLEVGAGTAALGCVVGSVAGHVEVTDVSLAWLVIACRRLRTAGADAGAVACTGENLPFADETFDVVLAADVIEHVPDRRIFATSCYRVLRRGGRMWFSTPNRLSPTPEPHVRLWAVGFLPRRLAVRYVQAARGMDYRDIHTVTAIGLYQTLRDTGGHVRITAPAIAPALRRGYSPIARALIDVYGRLVRGRVTGRVVLIVAPLFHAVVTKPDGR